MAFWAVPNQFMTVDGENGFELYGDFQCDAASDLADNLDGVPIARGSIAMDISTGDFYSRSTEGTWYAADGSGAAGSDSTPNASVNSTRVLTKSAPATTKTLTNSLLDIEPEESEFVEPKEVEVKDGGDSR